MWSGTGLGRVGGDWPGIVRRLNAEPHRDGDAAGQRRYYRDGLTVQLTGGTINALACTITTPQLTFPIGDISAAAFGSVVGTTPAVAQNTQNLGLNCSAGTNISVSLSGIQNPDSANTSVMALTGQGNSGTAKGVGVQLLYNGSPLTLNSRLLLKQSAGGQETLR